MIAWLDGSYDFNQDEKNCIFSIINLGFQNQRKKLIISEYAPRLFILFDFDFEFLVFCSVVDTVFVPNKKQPNEVEREREKKKKGNKYSDSEHCWVLISIIFPSSVRFKKNYVYIFFLCCA